MLAISSAFVSCSKDKDVYDVTVNENRLIENYNQAFVKTFGEPAANQTWGFGAPATSRVTRSRSFNYYSFPQDADASKFLDDVPTGVEKLQYNVARANNYIDETWQGELNIWGGATAEGNWQDRSGGVLYIKGNCDFSNRNFYFDGHSELYLVKGATLTLNETGSGNLQTYTNIYIAEGAKLIANGELKLNNGLQIFNHGTIEAPKLSTNSDSWLVNGGTVTIAGKISVENNLSVIENNGTITAADLNTAGSGKLENNGDLTVTGTTFVNSNSNTWVNNGTYHTGNFIYNAASDEVINNCNLTVDEDFNINLGDNPGDGNFKMGNGSGVVTKNFNGGGNWAKQYSTGWSSFNGGPFYIYMGSESIFKVTETATMNATKANYGVYGIGDKYAVFQAKNIVAGAANQGYKVTYGGNIAVVCETHFAQGYSGQYPYIDFVEGATADCIYTAGSLPNITIPSNGNCNAGFSGGKAPEVLPSLHVMAEDLTAAEKTDFDFNDVVIDVFYVDENTVNITLLAAGGTLPLRITENNAWEVHSLFDVPVTCMVNTGTRYHVAKAPYSQDTKPYVYLTLTGKTWSKDQNTFAREVRDQIKLYVQKEGLQDEFGNPIWTELKAEVGHPACKVATPVNISVAGWYEPELRWAWEKQYVGDGFADWVIDPSNIFYEVTE